MLAWQYQSNLECWDSNLGHLGVKLGRYHWVMPLPCLVKRWSYNFVILDFFFIQLFLFFWVASSLLLLEPNKDASDEKWVLWCLTYYSGWLNWGDNEVGANGFRSKMAAPARNNNHQRVSATPSFLLVISQFVNSCAFSSPHINSCR